MRDTNRLEYYMVRAGNRNLYNARKHVHLSECRKACFNLLNEGRIPLAAAKIANYIIDTDVITEEHVKGVVSLCEPHPFYGELLDLLSAILEIEIKDTT